MAVLEDVDDWIDENTGPGIIWYVKRLSGNDTLANGSHQAGIYVPWQVTLKIFPSLDRPKELNPDKRIPLAIDSHADAKESIRVIWYNNKLHNTGTDKGKLKKRNEGRLTNFGGASSAVQDPESTGALAVFAFHLDASGEGKSCNAWVCVHETQEDKFESFVGVVEPGQIRALYADPAEHGAFNELSEGESGCWLSADKIPSEWIDRFPTGIEIVRKSIELRGKQELAVDMRLLKRRICEYQIFQSIEQAVELPKINRGFANMQDFIDFSNSILQRRKSRAGKSLELHAREIFVEENLKEGEHFQYQAESESGKKPDFLFPGREAYQNLEYPAEKLRMLAVKTTCKDRWRQVLNEASRIQVKHLLTVQEGVSETQFKEMTDAGVRLVVPSPLVKKYPASVRPHLQSLESFIADVRLLNMA